MPSGTSSRRQGLRSPAGRSRRRGASRADGGITPLVSDLAMPVGHDLPLALPVARAWLLAGENLLSRGEMVRRLACMPRVLDKIPVARCHEDVDAQVDAGGGAGAWQWLGRHVVAGQHQRPAAALPLDCDRLDKTLDRPVDRDFHCADPSQIHLPELRLPAASITVFGPFHSRWASRHWPRATCWRAVGRSRNLSARLMLLRPTDVGCTGAWSSPRRTLHTLCDRTRTTALGGGRARVAGGKHA